ncbi:MAG TPA: hypothetical protein VGI10_12515 [Polyangiaceae bacterium]|jgi:hypothetical protein
MSTLSALDTALATATVTQQAIGRPLRNLLFQDGSAYDRSFPVGSASTLIESVAHRAWSSQAVAEILDLGVFAAAADGKPNPTPTPPLAAAFESMIARLKSASALPGVSAGLVAVLVQAQAVTLPSEPAFYVDRYYQPSVPTARMSPTLGQLEQGVIDAIADATAFLAVV